MRQSCCSLAVPLVIVVIVANTVFGSESNDYDGLMNKGVDELNAGLQEAAQLPTDKEANARNHFEKALKHEQQALDDFYAAERLRPTDPDPFFFRGATFNRIGELIADFNDATGSKELGAPKSFCAAVHELNRSIDLGMTTDKHPTLLVELAFALLKVGDNGRAKRVAGQFLARNNMDLSLRSKAEAIANKAEDLIEAAKTPEPIHICGKAPKAATLHGNPVPADTHVQSQFLKSITTGIGYNGNVLQVGRGLPLPATVPKKEAFFNESILSLEGDWFFHHKDGADDLVDNLAAAYAVIHDAYEGLSASNTLLQSAGLSYCRVLNTRTCVGLQVKDAWLRSDTKNISNTLALQPSISYAETNEFATQLSYALIRSDYSITPSDPLALLDGFTHQIAWQQTWAHTIRQGEWSPQITLAGKYLHQWTLTDGIVGDRQRDNPLLKAEWVIFAAGDFCSLVRSVSFAASYEYRHDQYKNATFPILTASNRFKRHDDTHLVGVALSVKLWYDEAVKNRLEAILEYQSTTNDSNVASKAYDQPRFIASVKANF